MNGVFISETALSEIMEPLPGATIESFQALPAGGADINLADKKGWIPLMIATDWGDAPVIELLVNPALIYTSNALME
jgi:ankyrin repeat protein